jgi:hypothetical protein
MITPHATAQYGQMLCVSVVREIFSSRAWASAGRTSKPKAVVTAALESAPLMKFLRDIAIARISSIACEGDARQKGLGRRFRLIMLSSSEQVS